MNTIKANTLNEMQKLLTKKGTKLFLLASVLIPVLTKILVNNLFLTDWMALPAENINMTLLDLFVTILIPLFIFIAATDLFTREGERGTLLQVRPISRMELFGSKVIAISILSLFILLLEWTAVVVSSTVFDKAFEITAIPSSIGAFVVSWFPILVLTAFAVMLALFVHSSVLAVSGMIVLYLIMLFIPYVLPGSLFFLPTAYLDWYMQWFGNVSIRWMIQTVTYLCSSFALFFTVGYYMFNRKEA
ncbi:ABC transporter permease subunit [Neobacillus niacini]|uniref:ABC transporter permease subunit n=1 Tax=Neobacillus niacini TaxID=86668 RepID=UPI0007ABEF11|nr:ABC transporter permease subunit [Neobacillus niacini]MEC1524767.1 ABC transporter permease subunit [Neobacillus niacini]